MEVRLLPLVRPLGKGHSRQTLVRQPLAPIITPRIGAPAVTFSEFAGPSRPRVSPTRLAVDDAASIGDTGLAGARHALAVATWPVVGPRPRRHTGRGPCPLAVPAAACNAAAVAQSLSLGAVATPAKEYNRPSRLSPAAVPKVACRRRPLTDAPIARPVRPAPSCVVEPLAATVRASEGPSVLRRPAAPLARPRQRL